MNRNEMDGEMKAVVITLLLFFTTVGVGDAKTPIGATVTFITGEATLHPGAGGAAHPIVKGTALVEGDRVITEATGRLVVRFDNGDSIQLSPKSDLLIKALHRTKSRDSFSVFGLSVGRVKSFVSKLATKVSMFEYQTKAAICGVAGTPPWTVTTNGEVTEVDLEGELGGPGAVYVRGTEGAAGEEVILTPNNRTVVRRGAPPAPPSLIPAQRLEELQRPFGDQSGAQSSFFDPSPPVTNGTTQVMLDHLTRKVSIPRRAPHGASRTLQELEAQYDQGAGLTTRQGSVDVPPMGRILFHGSAHVALN